MAYGFRPQRPGAIDPNDPRKKRLPLTPEEDPYGGILPDLGVDLPEPVSPLPTPALTQPGMPAAPQTGAELPMERWQTPPSNLTALRAWYSGAAKVPGAPPMPEWGKATPTYSRLNPPPPRQVAQPTPAPSPTAPVGQRPPQFGSVGQALEAQMQAPLQQAAIRARQPLTTRPTLGTPAEPTVSAADRQRFTLAEAERRALRNQLATQGAGQYLQEAGMGDLSPERFAPMPQPPAPAKPEPASWRERAALQSAGATGAGQPITQGGLNAVTRRAQEALLMGAAGAQAGKLPLAGGRPGYRTVPQIARDVALEAGAGTVNLGGMAVDTADIVTRSMGMMNPNYDPKSPGGFQALRDASENINKASETLLAQRTPEYLQRRTAMERQLAVAPQDVMSQIAAYASAIYEDPSMAEQAIVTNLPQMFPSLAAGKIASLGKAAQALKATRALSATAGTGLVQTAVDAAKSSYDTLKQQYMQQGMSSQQADQLAFQDSLPSFIIGGGIGAFTGGTGAEAALFKGGAAGIGQRVARVASELGGEVLEEAVPQAVTNVQLGRPVTQGLGRTIAETAIATLPFAGMAATGRADGGANKVPDALQTEVAQRYQAQIESGVPRAPLSMVPGVPSQRQGPGFTRTPSGGITTTRPQGPPSPQRPAGLLPSAPSEETQAPVSPATSEMTPEEAQYQFKGEWPVPLTFRTPVQAQMRRQQGPEVSEAVELGLEDLRREYATKREPGQEPYFTKMEGNRARKVRRPPTPRDVQGEQGYIAERMYHAPSLREFIDKGGAAAYGIKPEDNAIDAYERIVGGIASEMTELTGVPYSIRDVQNMGETAGIDKPAGWQQWFEAYGKARGLESERDMNSILAPTSGKQMGAMMPSVEIENLFGQGGEKAGQADRGVIHEALQQDMAKLFGIPYNEVSLTQITPTMWRQWAAVRNISPRGIKTLKDSIRAAEEFQGRTRLSKKETEARKERAMQPVSEWYEKMYGRPTSLQGRQAPPPAAPSAPSAPSKPTPPAPAAPTAPTRPAPSAPSPLRERYLAQTERGVPRAPLAFQPRSYAEGVASIERAKAEREEARQAIGRLKSKSPFDKAKQAEEAQIGEAIEGRRPEPPAATELVTPQPTPPAPPAPAGEAVTPTPARRKAAPAPASKPAPAQPVSEKTLTERGWSKQDANNFTGPNGEKLQRDPERRGQPWVYTDRLGNTQSFDSGKEAIKAIISEPDVAPPSRVEPTATEPTPAAPKTTQTKEGELPTAEFSRLREQDAARREAFLKDNPDLSLTVEDYVKTLTPEVRQKYAKYKALQAKFEAAKQPGSQVRFGAVSGKQMKELARELEYIFNDVGLAKGVLSSIVGREPVKASTVDALGIKLPEGYKRQGTQFVYEEKVAPTTATPEVPSEVKQIFDTLDSPQGKKSKTRKSVEAMNPDLGKKAIFVNDNIEQIIAEAEANGKVTKECP